jgi:hypothetical protein
MPKKNIHRLSIWAEVLKADIETEKKGTMFGRFSGNLKRATENKKKRLR